jgi:hypothetical protein
LKEPDIDSERYSRKLQLRQSCCNEAQTKTDATSHFQRCHKESHTTKRQRKYTLNYVPSGKIYRRKFLFSKTENRSLFQLHQLVNVFLSSVFHFFLFFLGGQFKIPLNRLTNIWIFHHETIIKSTKTRCNHESVKRMFCRIIRSENHNLHPVRSVPWKLLDVVFLRIRFMVHFVL